MSPARPRLKFFLDEGVPVSVGKALEDGGHEVIYFNNSGVAKGSADTMVCVVADANDAILVAHDKDMKVLAKGHGITAARFRSLSLLQLACRESVGAVRVCQALSLIEHEWAIGEGRERQLHICIGDSMIRSHR